MFKNNIKKLIEDFYRNFAGLPNDKAIVEIIFLKMHLHWLYQNDV